MELLLHTCSPCSTCFSPPFHLLSPAVRTAWCSPADLTRSQLFPIRSNLILSMEALSNPGLSTLVACLKELCLKCRSLALTVTMISEFKDGTWAVMIWICQSGLRPWSSPSSKAQFHSEPAFQFCILISLCLPVWVTGSGLVPLCINNLGSKGFPPVLLEWGPAFFFLSTHLPLSRTRGKFLNPILNQKIMSSFSDAGPGLVCWHSPSCLLWDFLPPSPLDLTESCSLVRPSWVTCPYVIWTSCYVWTSYVWTRWNSFSQLWVFTSLSWYTFKRLSFALRLCSSSL